ncbi:hypothetical protein THASP1DRAFT_15567, partial [Thamnocephalis sphaerospora]
RCQLIPRQCMYHHPYPVGFRASKTHFGREYWMTIEEGEDGPAFNVSMGSDRRHSFHGQTPTQPWTQACLASSSKGTRISGPLFFGFSDPLAQLLIRKLPGFQTWDEIRKEMAAKVESETRQANADAGDVVPH